MLYARTVGRLATNRHQPRKMATLLVHSSLGAGVIGEVIVGFGDIDDSGYLDRLFVHHAHQGEGIGSAIVD